ncbi:3-dehydroquinate synthase [Pelagibacteraceae bacterium]|nr:3-dehydroquinate synthase [Pelagibacteraceae bacterium]
MKLSKLIVKTKSKNYPIYFGNDLVGSSGKFIKMNLPGVKKICIISDSKLPKEILKKLVSSVKKYDLNIFKFPANEKTKNLNVANKIIEQLLKNNFNRSDCIISLGGGIVGDLSAFVANLTKRGLKFVNIPTTLLAQVDASIGGKTGINVNQGKNLIGTYYQPDFVLADIKALKSLPQREMISGYGEILKHALILDKKFFFWLSKKGKKIITRKDNASLIKAIIRSCKIKATIVKKDEKEKDLRMVLNFGHTFAHSFESAKKFSKNLNHGEAVLLGMLIASDLSNKKRLLSDEELLLIKKHYANLELFTSIKKVFKQKNEINKIISFMKKDKKNINKKINLILLNKIGKTKLISLKDREIKKFLNSYYN